MRAVVFKSSHTTPSDAEAFLSKVRKSGANVVALPTEFNVKAFNKLKRDRALSAEGFGTRFSEHDIVLVQGLLKIFHEKKGKFSVVLLKEPADAPSQHQSEEQKLAEKWQKRGWENWSRRGVKNWPSKIDEPKKEARRTQDELHAEAADLSKFIAASLAKGKVDEQEVAAKLRRQTVATVIRREMLRRALLDLPTSIHQQQPILKTLPSLKVAVQVSGMYSPSARNASDLIEATKAYRQGNIDYRIEFPGQPQTPRLTRVRLIHELVDHQLELMRKWRAPNPLFAKYFFQDEQIPQQAIHAIVFEEMLEPLLRQGMRTSQERFEAVTDLSRKLPQEEISRFVSETLPGLKEQGEIKSAYGEFLARISSQTKLAKTLRKQVEHATRLLE